MKLISALALLTLVGLAACSPPTARQTMFKELKAQRDTATSFPATGVTYVSFDAGHGYQVEYLAPGGRAYLWYPNNRGVVAGEWKTLLDEMCYRYGRNTFNPQTFQRGGKWDCTYQGKLAYHTTGEAAGDVFNLASGNIPYRRSKCDPTTIPQRKKVTCK